MTVRHAGVVRKQQRLPFARAIHLDLAKRLALESLDHDQIDPRHPLQQFRRPRFARAAQLMHQGPSRGPRTPAPRWRTNCRCTQESCPRHVDIGRHGLGMLDDQNRRASARRWRMTRGGGVVLQRTAPLPPGRSLHLGLRATNGAGLCFAHRVLSVGRHGDAVFLAWETMMEVDVSGRPLIQESARRSTARRRRVASTEQAGTRG